MSIAVVILAAGRGERVGDPQSGPKQYRRVGGKPVLWHTIKRFLSFEEPGQIIVAIHPDDHEICAKALGQLAQQVKIVEGGSTRQSSTLLALAAIAKPAPQYVMIHDGVRPFISSALIKRLTQTLTPDCGALPALAVTDTLKRSDETCRVLTTVDRQNLYAAQTPQAFPFGSIFAAHQKAVEANRDDFTDDAAIAEWAGLKVRIVSGDADNLKLTWREDLIMADEKLAGKHTNLPDVRTGNGYDVHQTVPGDAMILCGVKIPHSQSLSGHSDADVGLHALTDALLATLGAGDIGTHFPPSDPQWKGAASHIFVEHAVKLINGINGVITCADITLIAEAPRIGPHREAMINALTCMLKIAPERISVKATTNEKIGFVGRGEGVAAIATATVVYPGNVL